MNPDFEKRPIIHLMGEKNLVLDGEGETILLDGKATPFLVRGCENITIRNVTIDALHPSMVEFAVVSSEPGSALLRVVADARYEIRDNDLIWLFPNPKDSFSYNGKDTLTMVYSPESEVLSYAGYRSSRTRFPAFPDVERWEEVEPGLLRATFKDSNICLKPNDIYQTRHVDRNEIAGYFEDSTNIMLENVTIRFAGGMGLVFQNVKDIKLERVKFLPKKGRVISSQADFFHFSGCSGHIEIFRCEGDGAHDDVINIHGTHLRVVSADPKTKKIVTRFMNAESFGFNAFSKCEKIAFTRGDSLKNYAENEIIAAKRLNDYEIELSLKDELPLDIEVDSDTVENITRTPSAHIHDCSFSHIATRGILCTTRKEVLIERNRFFHIGGPVLLVADDCNFWFESGPSGLVRFENNEVSHGNDMKGPIIQYDPVISKDDGPIHEELIVQGNRFSGSSTGEYLISLKSLEKASIQQDGFDAPVEIIRK